MNTRTRKYKMYRDRIERTPENRFPKPKTVVRSVSHADEEAIQASEKATSAITIKNGALKKKRSTPYGSYAKKKRIWLIVKCVSLILSAAALSCFYFFWVIKG
jgi:hypothetical protein